MVSPPESFGVQAAQWASEALVLYGTLVLYGMAKYRVARYRAA